MELTVNILKEIIDAFADEGRIFSNEAQFQFALALALQNYSSNEGRLIEHAEDGIQLEVLSTHPHPYNIDNKCEIEKMYTDIVVISNGKNYAIELKYKTAYPSNGNLIKYTSNDGTSKCYTFGQGAADCGSYDFLKDVERLERLVLSREDRITFNFSEEKVVTKGFAIILSNDHLYWKERDVNNSPYKDFFLIDKTNKCGKLGEKNKNRSEERNNTIYLKNSYTMAWHDYNLKKYKYIKENKRLRNDYNFKYMILEINK